METNYELRKIDTKHCMCYYFDDKMRVKDISFDNILLDEKSYENILTHNVSCKTFMGAKPLCISFDKVDGIMKIYNGTRYLELFGLRIHNAIHDRINCLVSQKNDAKCIISHNFAKSELSHIILYL